LFLAVITRIQEVVRNLQDPPASVSVFPNEVIATGYVVRLICWIILRCDHFWIHGHIAATVSLLCGCAMTYRRGSDGYNVNVNLLARSL
jgi:hypothetical protein